MAEFRTNKGKRPAQSGYDRKKRDNSRQDFKKDRNDTAEFGKEDSSRRSNQKSTDFRKDDGRKPDQKRVDFRKDDGRRPEQKKADFRKDDGRRPEQKRADFRKDDAKRPDFNRADRPLVENNIGFEPQDAENIGNDRLEGRNPVLEALKAGRTINKILVAKGEREGSIKQIIAMAREKGIVIQEVDRRNLDGLSLTKSHQGIIAYVSIKDYVEVDDIIKVAALKGEPPFIVLLDEIADANNFGSILRTADAVGVHGVVIPKRRAVGLTPTVAKASAGAVEYVPVARVSNLAQTIDYLKKQNIWVVGTDQDAEKEFYNSDLKGPIALVIGSEGEGMGRLIREKCDFVVDIPMKGNISSLNAAVAGAVVMFEIMKQRGR